MSATSTLKTFAEELSKAFLQLKAVTATNEDFSGFMWELGWKVDKIPGPIQQLHTSLNDLQNALQKVLKPNASFTDVIYLCAKIKNVYVKIVNLAHVNFGPSFPSAFKSQFPKQLIDYMIFNYLLSFHPDWAAVFKLLGICDVSYQAETKLRPSYMKYEVDVSRLTMLISNPSAIFASVYGWNTKDFDFYKLFHMIQDYLNADSLRVLAYLEEMEDELADKLEGQVKLANDPIRWCLNIPIFSRKQKQQEIKTGLKLLGLPKHGSLLPGLALLPYAHANISKSYPITKNLLFTFNSSLDMKGGIGIKLRPQKGISIVSGLGKPGSASSASGNLKLKIVNKAPGGEPIVLLGDQDGSRLEYKTLSLVGGLYLSSKKKSDLYLELELAGGKIVIDPGRGDSFIKKILPKSGITGKFDLAPGISSERGFYFRGSGGLEISLSSHLSLGPVELQGFTIGIKVEKGKLPVSVGADVKAQLGPLTAVVQDMGIKAIFSFPKSGGNLGPINLDLDFKPPKGIGMSIDGQGFKGGGFLCFDPDNHRYYGVLELQFQKTIAIKAIGLLTTILPGGKKGFSLLIIITTEFTPIQLGYGFTLNGVGGMLGLNRTMKVEPLRKGLKAKTLENILFPKDVVKNCMQIISDLRQVYPPQEGRFVFGPMAKIGWGTPTLITIDLGLIIEIPNPVRIALLGVVKALLPHEKMKLLSLQVNFLGVIDFGKKQLAFDASLYDSNMMKWSLTGDMALRLCWGDDPNFLLTVGGFHPAYNPPAVSLRKLERLTVYLLGGKNPRITFECYFAVTSNTVQFGAKVELYAAAWKFNVYGFLAFDVLFQFSPFYFIASVSAMLAVRIGSASLFSISLALSLSGPTPWNAKGTASFKIFFFITVKVRFNKTWGKKANTSLSGIPVLPLLEKAVKEKANWQALIPANSHLQVSIKKIDDVKADPIVHPFGVLTFSQKVVPLDLKIAKFGHQKPKGPNQFSIDKVTCNKNDLEFSKVKEFFVPAQFIDMKDSQRLARKSFEKYNSGIKLTASEKISADLVETKKVKYELKYLQPTKFLLLLPALFNFPQIEYNCLLKGNAISRCSLSQAATAQSLLAPGKVSVKQEQFAVVHTDDLTLFNKNALVDSEAEAYDMMADLLYEDPGLADKIQVVPKFEVSAS